MVALVLLLAWRRSRVGAILRAGVADREMLGLLGIDLKRVFTGTFAFGAALAGLAGVVVGPYLGVYPGMDESILVLVLVVVVVGGLGSIEGAILGSLLIGLAYAIGPLVLPLGTEAPKCASRRESRAEAWPLLWSRKSPQAGLRLPMQGSRGAFG